MKQRLTCLAVVFLLLLGLFSGTALAANDHQASSWAREEVSDAVMGGLSPFPDYPAPLDYQGNVTRREFAGVALRLYAALTLQNAPILGKEAKEAPFTDVDADGDVNAAYALGLMNGVSDTSFEPERSISRQEICTLLDRVVSKAGASLPQPESAAAVALVQGAEGAVPEWARAGVRKIVASGLMKGTGSGYNLLGTTSREMALVLSLRTLRTVQAQPPLLGQRAPNGWAFAVEDADELMERVRETMPKAPDVMVFYTRQPVTAEQISQRGFPIDGNYTTYPDLALDYGLHARGWFANYKIEEGPEGYASMCTLKPSYEAWAYLDQYRSGLRSSLPPGLYAWADSSWVARTPSDYGPLTRAIEELQGSVILPDMSDYEKAKALHDYVAKLIDYDYAQYRAKDGSEFMRGFGYPAGINRALLEGKGVCAAYAETYAALCNLFGLRCVDTVGTAGGDTHGWNVVEVDGQWYHVDVTWDDKSSTSYRYFLVSDATLHKDHTWTLPYPVCSADYPTQAAQEQSPQRGGDQATAPEEPQKPKNLYQRNPEFPGTYLGETDDGLWEFEITIYADKKNQPYPFAIGSFHTKMDISDTKIVNKRAQYFYGYAPGQADVTYYVSEEPRGTFTPLCVIHVTVLEKPQ